MKIRWLIDCELETVSHVDADDNIETETVIVRKGELDEVDALAYAPDVKTAGFQFGNGNCVYGVPFEAFEVTEGMEELEEMA